MIDGLEKKSSREIKKAKVSVLERSVILKPF